MFDKPEHGWVNIILEGVEIAPASYISDVANDTLEAMIYALEESKDFCASYDAEGYEFKIISDDYSTFVIMMRDENELGYFRISKLELAKEILRDFETQMPAWEAFQPCEENNEYYQRYLRDLRSNVQKLKNLVVK